MKTPAVLRQYEKMGRHGDSKLAHVMPHEVELLKAFGGSGTRNPKTGLQEFWTGEGDSDGGGDGTSDDGVGGVQGGDNNNSVGVAPGNTVGSAQGMINALMGLAPSLTVPSDIAQQAHMAMGIMGVPSGAISSIAEAIGHGISAVTGATAAGATAAQGVVGTGGVDGASMAQEGGAASPTGGTSTSSAVAPASLYAPVGPALVNYTPPAFRAPVAAPGVLGSYSQNTQGQLPALLQQYADQEAKFRAATQTPFTASIYQPGMWAA